MVTSTYLPIYLCDRSGISDSCDSCDSCDSSDNSDSDDSITSSDNGDRSDKKKSSLFLLNFSIFLQVTKKKSNIDKT